MTMSTIARRGLGAAAVAATLLAGATVPATAAPATQGITGHAAAADAQLGPDVEVGWAQYLHGAPLPAPKLVPLTAGRPIQFRLYFELQGRLADYSDVHFSTSHPGTASPCDMSTIYRQVAKDGFLSCTVNLPAMKPGTSQDYRVTMTGKRAGKAFSVTRTMKLYAPNVEVGIYVDGKRVTGRYALPNKSSYLVKYVVDNHTPWTLRDLGINDEDLRCGIPSLAPGRSGVCYFRLERSRVANPSWSNTLQMWDMYMSFGSVRGAIGTAPQTYLVAR